MEADIFEIIEKIIHQYVGDRIKEILPINTFGTVNEVFDIHGEKEDYIIRLNTENKSSFEYPKEKWCIEQADKIGIPSPKVINVGMLEQFSFMIQNKINGVNGSLLDDQAKLKIWKRLGEYVRQFSDIPIMGFGDRIIDYHSGQFDDSWERHLNYNMETLNSSDPLLLQEIISEKEQTFIRNILLSLRSDRPVFGLVHGDLSCRNVIVDKDQIYLLDWGQAESHWYPYTEIGVLLNSPDRELDQERLTFFLSGIGLSDHEYKSMTPLIKKLHLLKRLDKYRWAYDQKIEDIQDYILQLRQAFEGC